MTGASQPVLPASSKGRFTLSLKAEFLSTCFYVLGSPDENTRLLQSSQVQSLLKREE